MAAQRMIGEVFVAGGADAGKMIPVADNTVLGRDDEADIVLQDPDSMLSRRHARIRLDNGNVVVEDLGSTNGTFVGGEKIAEPRALHAGDRIELGGTTLTFTPAPEPEPPAVPVPGPAADGELRIISGPGAGGTAPVSASATIGREPECDLQVLDGEVSRRHAKVTVRDGAAAIDDLRSANGTYVNGERILEPLRLGPGDRIEVGEATIVLDSPVFAGAAVHAPPAQPSDAREILTHAPQLLTADSGTRKWWTLAVVL